MQTALAGTSGLNNIGEIELSVVATADSTHVLAWVATTGAPGARPAFLLGPTQVGLTKPEQQP